MARRRKRDSGMETPSALPLSFKVRLDPEDAALLRRFVRARGSRSFQNTIVDVLREFEQRIGLGQQSAADEITYRRLYFDLLERTSSVQEEARALLVALDQARPAEVLRLNVDVKKR